MQSEFASDLILCERQIAYLITQCAVLRCTLSSGISNPQHATTRVRLWAAERDLFELCHISQHKPLP